MLGTTLFPVIFSLDVNLFCLFFLGGLFVFFFFFGLFVFVCFLRACGLLVFTIYVGWFGGWVCVSERLCTKKNRFVPLHQEQVSNVFLHLHWYNAKPASHHLCVCVRNNWLSRT